MSFLEYKTNFTGWWAADMYAGPVPSNIVRNLVNQAGLDVSGVNTSFAAGTGSVGTQTMNGRPVILGPGVIGGHGIAGPTGTNLFSAAINAKMVVAVVRVDSIATNVAGFENPAIFSLDSAASAGFSMVAKNSSPPTLATVSNDGVIRSVAIPFTLGQWGLAICQHWNGLTWAGWNDELNMVNGAAVGAIVGIGGAFKLLESAGGTQQLVGAVAEVLTYYDTAVIPLATQQLHLAKMCNYLRAKWLSPNQTIGSPSMRADALEQARDVGSRRLWFMRKPVPMVNVRAPLWVALDADTVSDIAMASPVAPSPFADGLGWKNSRPNRRRLRFYTSSIDLDNLGDAQLTLGDLHGIEHVYQETALALRASSLQRQGIAQSGGVRSFYRGSAAWIVDPGSGAVIQIDAQAEKVAAGGMLLEDPGRNMILRSCYISGLTGIATSGTAAAATIALDTAPPAGLLFDPAITANSLKFNLTATGTSGASTSLVAAHPAFATPAAIKYAVVSIDHIEDAGGSGFGYRIIRSSDGAGWDQALWIWTTTRGTTLNPMTVSSSAIGRFSATITTGSSSGFNLFDIGSNYTFAYGYTSGLAAPGLTFTAHTYQAEIVCAAIPTSSGGVFGFGNEPTWATSRIVTDASVVDRVADDLRYYSNVLSPSVGTFLFSYKPLWNASDVRFDSTLVGPVGEPGSGKKVLFFQCGPGSSVLPPPMWIALVFDAGSSALQFTCQSSTSAGGIVSATIPWSPVAGTSYRLAVRWTSPSESELGLPANTLSVFVNGVKGTDAVATSSALATCISPFAWSNTMATNAAFAAGVFYQGYVKTPSGQITGIQSLGIALTDQEIPTWQ